MEGITYTGLRSPLAEATPPFGSTRGVSNELIAAVATVTIWASAALVVHTVHADLP